MFHLCAILKHIAFICTYEGLQVFNIRIPVGCDFGAVRRQMVLLDVCKTCDYPSINLYINYTPCAQKTPNRLSHKTKIINSNIIVTLNDPTLILSQCANAVIMTNSINEIKKAGQPIAWQTSRISNVPVFKGICPRSMAFNNIIIGHCG